MKVAPVFGRNSMGFALKGYALRLTTYSVLEKKPETNLN